MFTFLWVKTITEQLKKYMLRAYHATCYRILCEFCSCSEDCEQKNLSDQALAIQCVSSGSGSDSCMRCGLLCLCYANYSGYEAPVACFVIVIISLCSTKISGILNEIQC